MKKNRKGPACQGFGLPELLVVMLLIALFYVLWLRPHADQTGKIDKDTRRELAQEKIDTSTPVTTLRSVQNTLAGVQATRQKQQEEATAF